MKTCSLVCVSWLSSFFSSFFFADNCAAGALHSWRRTGCVTPVRQLTGRVLKYSIVVKSVDILTLVEGRKKFNVANHVVCVGACDYRMGNVRTTGMPATARHRHDPRHCSKFHNDRRMALFFVCAFVWHYSCSACTNWLRAGLPRFLTWTPFLLGITTSSLYTLMTMLYQVD